MELIVDKIGKRFTGKQSLRTFHSGYLVETFMGLQEETVPGKQCCFVRFRDL